MVIVRHSCRQRKRMRECLRVLNGRSTKAERETMMKMMMCMKGTETGRVRVCVSVRMMKAMHTTQQRRRQQC
jgi:hypothetical protein